jgi:5-methylcytosine-specific restriction endonuclease McrA
MDTKVCSQCKIEKPISEFPRRKGYSNGIYCYCRECKKENHRAWKKTPTGKECERRYYQKNKDRILPRCAKYYLGTKGEHKERSLRWAKENPDKTKEIRSKYGKTPKGVINNKNCCHRRRELVLHGEGVTLEQWTKILDIQNRRCNGCGRKFGKRLKATEDHIIPLSKGGLHEFENIQALCGRCNSTKNANLDKEYIHTWITEGISLV